MSNQEIKQFVESFLKSVNAEYSSDENSIQISKISEDIEKLLGKKTPILLSFDSKNQIGELVAPGSNFLRLISSYLESKGQTTLVKLDFDRDFKTEFQHYFKLKNLEIYQITKTVNYKSLPVFTFRTILQYLNDRETLINQIIILDNQPVSLNLEAYKQLPGNKNEIPSYDLKEAYEQAKYHLKKSTELRIQETSENLSARLQREQLRIREHYQQRERERTDKINRIKEQLSQQGLIEVKMKRLLEDLSDLQNPAMIKKMQDEENFFIADEVNRHALNISNKIIATTLYYYPVYSFTIYLKSKTTMRQINLTYDPIKDILTPIQCETCKKEIRELSICSSGHIVCVNCQSSCKSCQQPLCNLCSSKKCDECTRRLCKKCVSNCAFCSRTLCTTHLVKDFASGKLGCQRCLKSCQICSQYTQLSKLNRTDTGLVCEKCIRLQLSKKLIVN